MSCHLLIGSRRSWPTSPLVFPVIRANMCSLLFVLVFFVEINLSSSALIWWTIEKVIFCVVRQGTLIECTTRNQRMLRLTGKRLTLEKASFMYALLFLKISKTGIKFLVGLTKIPPEDISFAFTMLTNVVQNVGQERWHRRTGIGVLRKISWKILAYL